MIGDFLFQGKAGLLHARGNKIGRKGGDFVGNALRESRGQGAVRRILRADDQRVGVRGKDLMVVVVGVVQEYVCIGNAIFSLDDRVIDLGNANEKDAVSG